MSLKDWYCNNCSLQFNKKSVFDMHLSIVHNQKIENGQKTIISKKETNEAWEKELFQCDVCDTQFKTKYTLKTH